MNKLFKQKNSINDHISKIIIIFSILALIPIFWISFYNHPCADDYNYSELYTQPAVDSGANLCGVLKAAFQTMFHCQNVWQGTYSAAFLDSIHPGIWGNTESFYAITAYILIFALFIGIYQLFKQLFLTAKWDTTYILPISLLTTLTIIEGYPSPVQGLFWYCGAMTYMFFFSFMLLQTALLFSILNSNKHTVLKVILGILNAFFIAGGNHISAFLTILITIGFFVFALITKKNKIALLYLLFSLSSILGFTIVMTAPGTAVRANVLERQSVLKTIIISAYNLPIDWIHNVNIPVLLLLTVLTILVYKTMIHTDNIHYFKFRYSALIFILSCGLYCASISVPYYAMGFMGAGRVDDFRYALCIISFVINYLYLLGCIISFIIEHAPLKDSIQHMINVFKNTISRKYLLCALYCFIGISVIIISIFNGRTSVTFNCALELLSGEAQGYDAERDMQPGDDVNDLEHKPKMIYFSSSHDNS